MDTNTVDPLAAAHGAVARHAWGEALDLFQQSDGDLSGFDYQQMADAAFFMGKPDLVIASKEEAFKAYLASGEKARAARMAIGLWQEHVFKGSASIGGAWLRRAERLLEGEPESFAHGYLALAHAELARWEEGDFEAARELAGEAVRIATQTGDVDLQALALVNLGATRIAAGELKPGFELMEEATVAALNGELSPFITGVTYCQVISVCRDLADYKRASEWTNATENWCEKQAIPGFPGICRVHRAEVVAQAGEWDKAEQELVKATAELVAYNATPPIADGYYALAQIRYRRGDLEGAEEAITEAHRRGKFPQPILSLIRLAQGNVRTAWSGIHSSLEEKAADTWTLARCLPAYIEIAIAANELEAARRCAEKFTTLVETYDALAMQADRELSWGRVLHAEGKPAEAAPRLRAAIDMWGRVPAPYEVAVSRQLLARCLRETHQVDEADLELQAAHRDFVALGAARDADTASREIEVAAERARGPSVAKKTFMFTDIVGSTNLAEMLGDSAWDQLLRWHDESLRAEFKSKAGVVANSTGDGFFVAFDLASDAVACAINIQRRLRDHRAGSGFAPMVRIGLHTAEANQIGRDYSGVGVHIAARVSALAGGEEIVASEATIEEAGWTDVTDRRQVTLKGVAHPVTVGSITWR